MTNEENAVIDPLGNTIFLLQDVCLNQHADQDSLIYDDAATAIRKPALFIEVKENEKTELFYFRSVGWNHTILIKARFNNNRWEIDKCTINPSTEQLSEILQKGKQLL